jgi:hypothetical protein
MLTVNKKSVKGPYPLPKAVKAVFMLCNLGQMG